MTAGLIALAASSPPGSPKRPAAAEDLMRTVREATAKYHDHDVAVADGYRRIGGDFPAMGEHWIQIGLLFGGRRDPARPEFLTYVTVAGRPGSRVWPTRRLSCPANRRRTGLGGHGLARPRGHDRRRDADRPRRARRPRRR